MMLYPCQKFFAPLIAVLLVGLSTPSSATPIAHLVLHSEPGDFIGRGQDFDVTYRPESSLIFLVEPSSQFPIAPNAVTFDLLPAEHPGTDLNLGVDLFFASSFIVDNSGALAGPPLAPGFYPDADRFIAGHPILSVGFSGNGCNTDTGNFTVTEATFLPGNILNSFGTTFEQQCEGAIPALFGTFTYSLSGQPVNTTVPEPSAWLLLASGIAGVVSLRRLSPT